MLATTAFHISSISNMPLYFFPPLLLFLYLFPCFLSPHPLSLWYSSSQPISSPHYLPYPCFFTITTSSYTMSYLLFHPSFFSSPPSPFLPPPCSSSSSSSTPSPLPAPPHTSSLITSYKFLPLSFIFSTPSPPPHYVLPLLLLLIPLLFILLPPRSPLFFLSSLLSPLFSPFFFVPSFSPSFISTPFCCLNLGLSI